MTIMNMLCFAALLPGVFLLILAVLKKAEETRQMNELNARMRLRNKQMRMD
jgi:hypothetical protein